MRSRFRSFRRRTNPREALLAGGYPEHANCVLCGERLKALDWWCLDGVEQCWKNKERFMKGDEHTQAVAAYDHARKVYRTRLAEADVD